MEGKDCYTAAWFQRSGKFFHKIIEDLEFPVHINTQCLENSLACFFHRVFPLFFRKERQCLLNDFTKLRSGIYVVSSSDLICDGLRDLLTVRLIGILIQHSGKLFS